MRQLNLAGHVGFDSLPDQLVNKITHQGFCFNILCIGETGVGKSTLMNTLFNTNFGSELLVWPFQKFDFLFGQFLGFAFVNLQWSSYVCNKVKHLKMHFVNYLHDTWNSANFSLTQQHKLVDCRFRILIIQFWDSLLLMCRNV